MIYYQTRWKVDGHWIAGQVCLEERKARTIYQEWCAVLGTLRSVSVPVRFCKLEHGVCHVLETTNT